MVQITGEDIKGEEINSVIGGKERVMGTENEIDREIEREER